MTSMRTIERTTAFKRDFKREAKGRHRGILDIELRRVIGALASDEALEPRHRDHALSNDWKDYRDCTSVWPAAGFVDTEIGCFLKPEVAYAATEIWA